MTDNEKDYLEERLESLETRMEEIAGGMITWTALLFGIFFF